MTKEKIIKILNKIGVQFHECGEDALEFNMIYDKEKLNIVVSAFDDELELCAVVVYDKKQHISEERAYCSYSQLIGECILDNLEYIEKRI